MNPKIKITLLLLLCPFILATCGKKATKINPDYVGGWYYCYDPCVSCSAKIVIDEKSHGEYESWVEDTPDIRRKGIARVKNGVLSIGLRIKWNIDQPPTRLSTVCPNSWNYEWYMMLNGDTFYR